MIGLLGVGISGLGIWVAVGWLGALAVVLIGLSWYHLSELYAVALGNALFLLFLPVETLNSELLIAELGLLVLLATPTTDSDAPVSLIITTVAILCVVVAISAGSYAWSDSLWITASVLLGTLLVSGYALYRYEVVRLDLVTEEPA